MEAVVEIVRSDPVVVVKVLVLTVGASRVTEAEALAEKISKVPLSAFMMWTPVPVNLKKDELPVMAISLARKPRLVSMEPSKVLEPTLLESRIPVRVRVPDMEAAPPTSKGVLVTVPALIPRKAFDPVNSTFLEEEAPPDKVKRPEMEAVLSTSRLVEKEAPASKTHRAVTVSA
mgnify:CR=1 FL=1